MDTTEMERKISKRFLLFGFIVTLVVVLLGQCISAPCKK